MLNPMLNNPNPKENPMLLNSYRMMETAALVEAGLAASDDLTRALAERLDDVDAALGMAEHVASDADQLRVWLADAEAELAGYRAAELTGGHHAQ